MNLRKKTALAVSLLALAASAFAIDGRTVMQNAFDVKEPAFSHSAVRMDLIGADGSTETRQIEEWGRDAGGLKSIVMAFQSPASVKGTRFLQIANDGRADDKWIFLPALRSTRRVASSEGSKSFMGTDASYDDLSSRDVDLDDHVITGEETVNGFACYVVKSTAKKAEDSQYAYKVSYIDKNSWVPVKAEMYDKKSGELQKTLVVEKLEKVSGYWIPMSSTLKNVQTGHSTHLVIVKIEVDNPLSDKLFTTNFLSTGRI